MMKKPAFSNKKTGWLAGSLSLVVLLSGGVAAQTAMAASSAVAPELQQSVTTSAYGAPAPLPAPPHPGGPAPIPGLPPMELDHEELLNAIHMEEDHLRQALESGQSLYDIAAAQGANMQHIVTLAANALTATLDRELKDGRITSEQYQARVNEAAGRAEAALRLTPPRPPAPDASIPPTGWGPALGPGLEQIDPNQLLAILGISSDKLAGSLSSGQSLYDIAAAQGVDPQQLVNLAAQAMTYQLGQELSEKRIWTDEYESRKQDIPRRAADAIQHKHPQPLPHTK